MQAHRSENLPTDSEHNQTSHFRTLFPPIKCLPVLIVCCFRLPTPAYPHRSPGESSPPDLSSSVSDISLSRTFRQTNAWTQKSFHAWFLFVSNRYSHYGRTWDRLPSTHRSPPRMFHHTAFHRQNRRTFSWEGFPTSPIHLQIDLPLPVNSQFPA